MARLKLASQSKLEETGKGSNWVVRTGSDQLMSAITIGITYTSSAELSPFPCIYLVQKIPSSANCAQKGVNWVDRKWNRGRVGDLQEKVDPLFRP